MDKHYILCLDERGLVVGSENWGLSTGPLVLRHDLVVQRQEMSLVISVVSWAIPFSP